MITLIIEKKWFDKIASGEKKEEYRKIDPYYTSRFANDLLRRKENNYEYKFEAESDIERQEYHVKIINGYGKNRPTIECLCLLEIGYGKEEWGAEPNTKYYVLKILKILNISNSIDKMIQMLEENYKHIPYIE